MVLEKCNLACLKAEMTVNTVIFDLWRSPKYMRHMMHFVFKLYHLTKYACIITDWISYKPSAFYACHNDPTWWGCRHWGRGNVITCDHINKSASDMDIEQVLVFCCCRYSASPSHIMMPRTLMSSRTRSSVNYALGGPHPRLYLR